MRRRVNGSSEISGSSFRYARFISLEEKAPVTEPAQAKPSADRQIDSETDTEAVGIETNRQIISLRQELRAKEKWCKINGLAQPEGLSPDPTERVCKDGRIVNMVMISTDLRNKDGQMYEIATMERVRDTQPM